MAKALAWLLIVAGAVGILFMKPIHEELLGEESFFVVILAASSVFAAGWLLLHCAEKGLTPPLMLSYLSGNAYLCWSVALAALAVVLCLIYPLVREPSLKSFRLLAKPEGTVGHTEPLFVRPGDKVKLTVDATHESLIGLWYTTNLAVRHVPSPSKWHFARSSTAPFVETWETDGDHFTGPGVHSPQSSEECLIAPWISLTLPNDPDLWGTSHRLRIRMGISFPTYVRPWNFRNSRAHIDREIDLHVSTREEAARFDRWQASCERRRTVNGLRIFGAFCLGIASLGLAVEGGRRASVAVSGVRSFFLV